MDKRVLIILMAGVTFTSAFNLFSIFEATNPCLGIAKNQRVKGATCNSYYLCDGNGLSMAFICPNSYPYFDECNQKCATEASVCDNCVAITTSTTQAQTSTTTDTTTTDTTTDSTTTDSTTTDSTTTDSTTEGSTTYSVPTPGTALP